MESAVKVWRKQQKTKYVLGNTGVIVTWTRILVSPPEFANYTPYIIVLVELENKERVYGQLVDYDEKDLVIGAKVIATLRQAKEVEAADVIEYGVKFKPLR